MIRKRSQLVVVSNVSELKLAIYIYLEHFSSFIPPDSPTDLLSLSANFHVNTLQTNGSFLSRSEGITFFRLHEDRG
jgi:hypothetical protein